MKNKKILIALRNYEIPNLIAQYGAHLAKVLDRNATIMGISKSPVLLTTTGMGGNVNQFEMSNMKQLQKIRLRDIERITMNSKATWSKMDYEFKLGFPEVVIANKAEEDLPYAVVIEGDNNFTTFNEWFGTYETRLADDVDVPVLVVPSSYVWEPVNQILYLMELTDNKARNIRRLYEMAQDLNAHLHVMLVGEDDSDETYDKYNHIVKSLQQFYDYNQVRYSIVTNVTSAAEVKNMSENMMIDWLAIEHDQSSFIERIFSSYNSGRLILKSDIPVLVF